MLDTIKNTIAMVKEIDSVYSPTIIDVLSDCAVEIKQLRLKLTKVESDNRHLTFALADVEALEMGTSERLTKAELELSRCVLDKIDQAKQLASTINLLNATEEQRLKENEEYLELKTRLTTTAEPVAARWRFNSDVNYEIVSWSPRFALPNWSHWQPLYEHPIKVYIGEEVEIKE